MSVATPGGVAGAARRTHVLTRVHVSHSYAYMPPQGSSCTPSPPSPARYYSTQHDGRGHGMCG